MLANAKAAKSQSLIVEENKDAGPETVATGSSADGTNSRELLDPQAAALLRTMYKELFPEIISTILKLKSSRRIEPRCK